MTVAKRWRGPTYEGEFPSLGWGLVDWMEAHLRVPAGDRIGEPLRLTDEQVTFVVRAHRIDPVSGRMVFRRAVLRRAKGWGKSPIMGGLALGHLVGPCRFDGWDANGEPVGVPHPSPLVQVAATAKDQTDNTWSPIMQMVAESEADSLGLDMGLTRIFVKGRPGKMEPVTAEAPSKEGAPVTFSLLDETHLLTPTNGGVKLAATLRRNVAKNNGFSVETTNAHRPGVGSVAEMSFEAAQRGTAGLLYDSLEAPEIEDFEDRAALLAALRVAYGDSFWVDLERLADEFTDPATDPADARRFYLNQLVAAEEDAVELVVWDVLVDPAAVLAPRSVVALGFDGADNGDSAALVAVTADLRVHVLDVWERPEDMPKSQWEVPRRLVHAAVEDAFERFRVARFYCDPPYWQTDIDGWRAKYGDEKVRRWATFSDTKMAEMTARFDAAVRAGSVRHAGDPVLRRHLAATRRTMCGKNGWRPGKKDARKIDAFVALLLAMQAHGDATAAGEMASSEFFVY